MIRGDQGFPKADGGFQALRGRKVSWQYLGKITGAPTHPLGHSALYTPPAGRVFMKGKKILLVREFGSMWL